MTPLILAAGLLLQAPDPIRMPNAEGGERPVYRKLQPGEQRDEVLLRRIVCPGRGPVTLVVKQQDKVVQYTAAQLAAIDFVDYRKDARGVVTCEGFGRGVPVYVTWKPEGKVRRAIAVEFLRK